MAISLDEVRFLREEDRARIRALTKKVLAYDPVTRTNPFHEIIGWEPTVTGIRGESGMGKTYLLNAIGEYFRLESLEAARQTGREYPLAVERIDCREALVRPIPTTTVRPDGKVEVLVLSENAHEINAEQQVGKAIRNVMDPHRIGLALIDNLDALLVNERGEMTREGYSVISTVRHALDSLGGKVYPNFLAFFTTNPIYSALVGGRGLERVTDTATMIRLGEPRL